MDLSWAFLINSILLGVGLAMDAFSVSTANGLNEPHMKPLKMIGVAGTFAFFQGLMPLIGWICVHTVVNYFRAVETFVPWSALLILGYIGTKMIIDGVKQINLPTQKKNLSFSILIIQGIATSLDALSVGFTIADYQLLMAILAALVIAFVTLIICFLGLIIGKKFGTKLSNKASIFGGVILVGIGIEIFITVII